MRGTPDRAEQSPAKDQGIARFLRLRCVVTAPVAPSRDARVCLQLSGDGDARALTKGGQGVSKPSQRHPAVGVLSQRHKAPTGQRLLDTMNVRDRLRGRNPLLQYTLSIARTSQLRCRFGETSNDGSRHSRDSLHANPATVTGSPSTWATGRSFISTATSA